MSKLIVVLNGPIGVGKDTLALALQNTRAGIELMALKDALFTDTAKYFGVPRAEFIARHNDRNLKELPWWRLILANKKATGEALSTRQALIHVSESVIKPRFGLGYYGKCAGQVASLAHHFGKLPVFTDGGFNEEAIAMVEAAGPEARLLVVRLHRPGCSFAGDSRDYIAAEHPRICYAEVQLIAGEVSQGVQDILEHINQY